MNKLQHNERTTSTAPRRDEKSHQSTASNAGSHQGSPSTPRIPAVAQGTRRQAWDWPTPRRWTCTPAQLQAKGWIELKRDTKRGIRLVGDTDPGVPLVDLATPIGEIAAGDPIVAESRIVDQIPSSVAERFSPTPDYFLTVRGDSMNRTGLRDGDVVAIRATPEARHRDVVVARFGDEVTLKRFFRRDERHVELRPDRHNREHKAIKIDLAKHVLHIDGVAVGALIGRFDDTTD